MNMRNHDADITAARSPFRLKPLVHAVQLALLPGLVTAFASIDAEAAPSGGQVRAGSAHISHDAAHGVTTVKQNTPRTAIDWQSFNVAKGEQVRFKQPNAKAVALNRIFDQKPSQIFGQVKANGQVVLLNPNGVFFRPGAEVNVGGLIAGAMRVGVDEFMSGRYVLKAEDGSDGRVLNQGRITAADGGDVALIGKTVANEGAIVATAGRVNLLAGDQTTVDFDGDGLLRFKVDKAVVDNAAKLDEQISNSGQISADGGQILITARAAAGVFDQAINNAGVIKAGRVEKRGGKIMLVGSGPTSSVLNTGSIDASAASDNDDGGRISVRANVVDNRGTLAADATHGQGGSIAVAAVSKASFNAGSTVTATSTRGKGGSVEASAAQLAFNFDAAVDVSGHTGGGTALLGGDLHGANPDIDNAERVFVGSQASIKADAGGHGDGGKVVVWADDSTRFHGKISARGGARGGDGGQVEVSGKQTLDFTGEVDTSAPRGKAGELLLDPSTLTITDANANTGSLDSNISNADADISGDADAGGNTISWGKIDSLAVTTNIILEATGLVTINDVTGGAPAVTTTNNAVHLDLTTGSLTIRSTGGNVVFADQNDIIETKGGAVTLSAANGTVTAGGIKTNVSGGNGAVTIISGTGGSFGDITTGGALFTANVGAGTATQVAGKTLIGSTALTKTGLGALTLSEANSHIGATTVSAGTLNVTNAAGLGTTNGGTTVASGAVLVLDNVSIGSEALTLGGGTLRALGTANVDGNITLTANSAIDVPGSELILGGVISGVGFGIDKQGAGRLTLNNTSSYSGTTTITDGSIFAGVDDVFANSILNIAGAAARFEMETTNQTVVGLAGSGVVSNDEPSANAVTFTINGGSGQTFSGQFFDNTADDISVVKTGAGTQTFSVGASTYAGSLTIDDGTLSITTANSLGDAVAGTTVSNNGTLDLNNLALASTEAIDISDSGIANVGALTATGTSSIGATNILTMGADATIGGSGTLTLNTALDNGGSRALTKTGSGTLVLGADNSAAFTSATGTITINAGAIKVTDVGGLGDTVGGTTIANDAQLEFALGGNASVAENLSFEGNGGANGAALLHSSANVLTLTGSLTLTNVGLANDATISVSNAGGVMSVGAISDGAATLSLTKVGNGALLMTAAQTYNGVTHVDAGTLRAGLADVLTAGAGLDLGATGVFNLAGFDQSLAKLDGAAGALVTNDVGGTADIATLTITGGGGSYAGDFTENGSDTLSLVKSGTGTQSLSVASGSYDGGTSITGGTLSILTEASLGTGSGATTANGGTLELNGVSLTGSETIHLSGSGNGGVGALTGIGAVSVESGNSVVLDADTSMGGAGTLTINAVISESGGARALTKLGAGTVVLGGNNSYTGATTVNAGTLEAGAVDVLDNSSGVNLAVSGARLNLAGFDQTLKKLDGVSGTVATNDAGSTADVATLTINAGGGNFAGNLTENGSDALTLTKSGSGTQILSGSGNTYTGNTIVSGGTLQAGADNVLGAGDLNVSLAGATFNLAGFDQTVDELDGIAGAIVTNDAGNTANTATLTVTGSGTYAGDITENGSDTLSLAKTTGGILTLSVGTGTFDGAVTITGGAISITTAASLGTATAGTVVNGGTLSLANFALASSESLSLAGAGGGSGALQSGAGVSSIAASNAITLTGNATIGTSGVLTINSVIAESGGARTLTKNGTGQLTLTGNNSYSGATTISEGTLAAGAADVLDNSSGVNLSVSGATLNLAGFNQSLAKLDGVAGAVVTNNAGNSGDTATLTITAGGGSFSGDLTQNGTDALSLVKSGTGSQSLAVVTGTYTGTTTISGGTLSVATDASLGTSAGATTANGGTLNLNGIGVTGGETINISGTGNGGIGALTSTGTAAIEASGSLNLAGDATIGGSGTLTLNAAVTESGGARSLTKTGSSNLVLGNGANSYTGSTTIAQGTVTAAAVDVLDNSAGLNLSTSGASFNLAGFDQTLTKLDGVAGTTVTNSTAAVTDAATLTISGNGGVFAGNLTEPGDDVLSFTKSGVGTQTLSGSGNSFSGPVTVSGGVLKAGVANVLGLSSGLDINAAGATFNLAGFDQSLLKLDGVAGAILTNDAGNTGDAATLTITGGGGVFAGDITETGSDTLSITKSTTGTQTLSVGTGSYDGVTTVSGGRLIVTSAASLGSSSGGLVINNAANAGATLELGTPGGTSFADTLTFSGGNNPTLLQSTGGTTTFTGGIVMSSDGTADIAQAGGTLAVTTVGISGAGTLTKTGPGTLQLGVATTLGGLNLAQGVLAIGLANALAASTDLTLAAGTTFNLHGFNQTIASLSGNGIVTNDDTVGGSNAAATLTIAAGGGSFTGTISESADDVLSLTKSGTGTQTLASANSYTGLTTVSGGTLAAGAVDILTSTSGLSITAAGASFNLAGFDQSLSAVSGVSGGIVTNNSTAANDSATLTITGNGGSYAGNITESADDALSFTKSGSGTQTLSGTNTYTGATTVNAGTLQAGAVNILGSTSGLNLNGAGATFNLAGFDQQVGKLDGAAGNIVTNNAGNSGDIATLTITGGGGSFSGDITETGSDTLSITKSGSGTQTLSVATGSYDGATSVSGGTLLITTSASLGSASGQTTASTGTLDLGALALASSETINLTGSGAGGVGALTGSGSVAASNAIVVTGTGAIGTTATFTVNAAIGGSGTLSKVGSGTLVLSGNNSYSGGTTIAAGTLTAGAANVLDNSSGVSVAAGATLNLAGFDQAVTKLDGVATSVVTNDAGGLGDIATLSISGGGGSYTGNLTQNGIDDLSITKSGTGSQSFAVVSGTYAGATTISGGTLSISTAASLGALTGNTTANGGTLDISGFTLATGEAISLNGSGNGGAGALTGTGTAAISNALTLTGNASIGGTGTFTVNSVISESGGARSLTKSGAGTVILANGANTYSGATIVAQGALQAGAVDVLANSSGLNLNASGASFNLAGFDQTIARLDGVAGSIVTNNAVAVGDAATLAISGGGGSYAGDMTESGGDTLALSKSGSGTQTLNVGTGSYNGATLVSGGTLRVASTASLGTTVGATTANGGTLDAAFSGSSGENLVLNGSGDGGAGALMGSNTGTFSGTVSLASAASINVDNGAAGNIDFTLSGTISGAGGNTLTKLGPDTLVLSGTNSYAGDTQIDAGVLKLGAASGVASGSAVHIAAGATFDVNDQAASIGSLGGGSGTLDLGLGSLAASDDVDLTGISVVFAAAGSGNQTLRAGSDGSGSLTVDALSKSSTGNLTLIGPTLIDINGDVAVNAGNLSINNAFSAAGDLVASGNVTLSGLGSLDGAATQSIDAQGGTLTTIGLTKTAGGAGNLSLGGGTAISASGDVAVQTVGGDLLVADNITTDSNLSAAHDVVFQGAGTSTFNAAGVQTITATGGAVRDTAGAVLAKSGGANLVLDAGGAVGVSAGNALGVALTGGSALEVVSGGDVFVTSASSLTVAGLATGAGADTVDIRTSGASAALTMSGPYTDVASDDLTLVAARDLEFDTNPLTVGTLDASFGQGGTSSDFDIDVAVSATTPGGFSVSGGAGANDRIDASDIGADLGFTLTALDTGNVSDGLVIDSFSGVESLLGGGGNDTLAGSVSFTVSGANSGSASALTGSWSQIENLAGSAGANTFNLATGGSLSGGIDGLGGTDTLSYSGRAAAVTIDFSTLTAPDIAGGFANIETFVGGSGTGDTLVGANNASNWAVTGANTGTIDDTTVGAPGSVEVNFSAFEILEGGSAADTFSIAAGASMSGSVDGGGGIDTFAFASRASAVTVNLETGTAADGTSTFANFDAFENFTGSAAATDKLVGRNQKSDWRLTASGAGSIDDTPNGAPDGTPEFTFTAFENLQGGSAVDTFTAATGGALTFGQLAGGAGNDVYNILSNAGSSTVLTANLVGEADNDTVNFGLHENAPPTNPSANEFSRLVGSINLGAGTDTLDYSGSDLVLVNAVTDNDSGSGQAGTVRDASTNNPPNLALVSGSYVDVDAVVGNGTQLQGADVETVWVITGNGRGRYGNTFATATTTFENFSIRGGNKRDVFIFKQEGPSNTTPQLFAGIDGGDFVAGNATTHNFMLGSVGADQFAVTGADAVSITLSGGSGIATTDAININNIGDAGLALTSGFNDTGNDTVTVQAGRTWAGNLLTNGGNDSVTLGDGARVAGTLNLGAGNDLVDASAYTGAITAQITAATAAGMSASTSTIAGDFSGVETLNLGSGNDVVTMGAAPTGSASTINMGAGGSDELRSQVDATWVLSGDGAGELRGVPGTASDQLTFSGVDDLTTTGNGVLSVPGAAASVSGNVTADNLGFGQASVDVGALGLRVVGNITHNGPLSLSASGGGDLSVRGNVSVDGAFSSSVAGGTATYGSVTTSGADQSYQGATVVRGDISARDIRFADAADLRGVVSGRNMNFDGNTTIGANLSGQDLHFNGPLTVTNEVVLRSSSNIFDFNDEVSSDSGVTLSIVPTANTDMFVDLEDGAGHVAADRFENFKGTLSIGGQFTPAADGDVLNGVLASAPADYITVSESLVTGGNLVLVGSTVDFSTGNNISVGTATPGSGTIVVMALGDKVQAGNDGLPGGVDLGNITAPTGGNTVTFTGAQVMLAATNEVQNSTNMIMDLDGGEVLVAQGARATKTRIDFNVRSRAQASATNVTDTGLVASLTALGAPTNLLQNTRASFPNPAAILTILQAVTFVDSSLFEEDLSLFGVIGDGIAKSLDQCEGAEGCAPNVTEEQLAGLIAGLEQRIDAIRKSIASGETAQAKGETLLSQYQAELASYRDYQSQLHAYLEKQRSEEQGGDEFEDVFEAEETPDAAGDKPADAAATEAAPANDDAPSLEEGSEDLFAPLEDAPAPAQAAPEDAPADVDEGFETLDESPAPAPAASPAPAPAAPATPAPAAPAKEDAAPVDDFEELEELPEPQLLNEMTAPGAVNQIAGLVRLDAQGAVAWSGDVILPTLHRRY